MDDKPLPYWHAMHKTAIVAQCFSLLGSATIIISFAVLKSRRKIYNYQILFINIADFFWVFWHFTNHIDALNNGHVTDNKRFCTAMGMFTHLGIGWELMWLMSVASYSAYLIHRVSRQTPSLWKPPRNVKIGVSLVCWGFPILWWLIIGVSTNSYESTGYYCWVKLGEGAAYRPWMFADGPLLISFAYIVICYGYVIITLLRMGALRKRLTGHSYSSEVRKYIIYIVVYALWVHPYVAISLMQITGYPQTETYYNFWLYFLLMVNSLGTLNFLAYGYSEGWYRAWRLKIDDVLSRSDSGNSPSPKASKDSKILQNSKNPTHSATVSINASAMTVSDSVDSVDNSV